MSNFPTVSSGARSAIFPNKRSFYTRAEKALAEENMERLGIISLAKRCYRDLSGGQQQRVLLARALGATRKLLLLDEPIAGLDPQTAADMYRILAELHQTGVTILMITHDVLAALPYATHILHLGNDVFWGTQDEYRRSYGYEKNAAEGGRG